MKVIIKTNAAPYKVPAEKSADGFEKNGFTYFAKAEGEGIIKFSSPNKYVKGDELDLPIALVDVYDDEQGKTRKKYREIVPKQED